MRSFGILAILAAVVALSKADQAVLDASTNALSFADPGAPMPVVEGETDLENSAVGKSKAEDFYNKLRETSGRAAASSGSGAQWCGQPWWCRRLWVYKHYRYHAKAHKASYDNLLAKIKTLQQEATTLQDNTAKAKKSLATSQNSIVRVQMIGETLSGVHAAAMEMLNAEKMRRTKLANEASRVVARARGANIIKASLNGTIHKLEAEIKRIQAESESNEERTDKLAATTVKELEESGKIAGQAAAKRVELKLLIDEGHDEIKAQTQRLAALKDALADTQRRRNETRDAAVAATHEFERLVKAKEAAEAEAQGLEMKITTLEARYATAADEKRAAMDVAAKEMHEQQDAEDEDRKTSMHADSLSEEQLFVNRVLGENKEATAETEAQLAALGERRAQLLGEIGKLSNATAALRSRKERLEAHHDELRSNATAIKEELAHARGSLADAVLKVKEHEATAERARARADREAIAGKLAHKEALGFAASATMRRAKHVETMAEGLMGFCDCSEDEEGCDKKCGPHIAGAGADAAAEAAANAAKLQAGAKKALEEAKLVEEQTAMDEEEKAERARQNADAVQLAKDQKEAVSELQDAAKKQAEESEAEEEKAELADDKAEAEQAEQEAEAAQHLEEAAEAEKVKNAKVAEVKAVEEEHNEEAKEDAEAEDKEEDSKEDSKPVSEEDAAERFAQLLSVQHMEDATASGSMRFRETRALRGASKAKAGAEAEAEAKDDPLDHVPKEDKKLFTPPKRWRNWPWPWWCIWRHKWCRYENYAWNLLRHYAWRWYRYRHSLWWRRNRAQHQKNRAQAYFSKADAAAKAAKAQLEGMQQANQAMREATDTANKRKDAIIKQMKEIDLQMQEAYKGLAAAQGQVEMYRFEVEDLKEERLSEQHTLERTAGNMKKAEDIQAKASEDLAATRKATLSEETQLRESLSKLATERRDLGTHVSEEELDLESVTTELHSAQASREQNEGQVREARQEFDESSKMRDQKAADKAKIEEEISATRTLTHKAKEAAAASVAAIKAAKSSMAATQSEIRQLRAKLERTKAAMHAAGSAHALSSGDSASIGIAVRRLQDAVAEKEAESEVLRAQLARMAEETAVYQDQLDRAKVTREALQREVDEAKQRVSAAGAVARKEAKDADLAEAEREARASERDEMARSRGLMARTPLERMSELLKQRRALEGVLGGERAESTSKKLDEAEGEAGLLAKQLAEQEAAAAAAMAAEADKGKAGVSAEQEEDAVEKEAEDLVENPAAKDHEALEELAEATTVTPEDLPKDSASGDRQLDDMMGMGSALSAEEQAAEDKAANPAAAGEGEAAPASDNAGPAAVSGAASSAGEGSQDSQDAQNAMSDATGEDSSEEG